MWESNNIQHTTLLLHFGGKQQEITFQKACDNCYAKKENSKEDYNKLEHLELNIKSIAVVNNWEEK